MPISKKDEDKKIKKDENINKSKIFAIIMILFVIGIATGAIIHTIMNSSDPVASPSQGNNNTTTQNTITPNEGYSLISLGGLDFFVKNDCAEKFKNGDYFDSFYGGKDFHTDFEHQAPWEKGPINNSQIITSKEVNGVRESFWLEISIIGDTNIGDNLYQNDEIRPGVSKEIIEVDGRNVTIMHTSENFESQSIGPNATIAIIEHKNKLIFMMWEGIPMDMYIIESFFKLN
jgi:hypothetical protein